MVKSINIETLILVAIWNKPAIFQGFFIIEDLSKSISKKILIFRSEYAKDQGAILDGNFAESDFQFTDLINSQENSYKIKSEQIENALYY